MGLILLLPLKSMAELPCTNQNFADRFGPVRDQNGHGSCWMMVAASLYEEQVCNQDSTQCGKSISAISASRCDFTLGKEVEGGRPWKAMECMLDNGGACLEEHAPYQSVGTYCRLKGFLDGSAMACGTESLLKKFRRARGAIGSGYLNSELGRLWHSLPYNTDIKKDELVDLVLSSPSEREFIQRVYLPKKCQENLIPISNKKIVHAPHLNNVKVSDYARLLEEGIGKGIVDGLNSGNSVGVSLDMGFIKGSSYKKGSRHAVVINGMKLNVETGKCEINIRNSWGVGGEYNGWFPLEDVLPAMHRIYRFGDTDSLPGGGKNLNEDTSA